MIFKLPALAAALLLSLVGGSAGFAQTLAPPLHLRQLAPPRVLMFSQVRSHEQWAELLRHDLPADITYLPWGLDHLDYHHLCDNPVRQSDADRAYAGQRLHAAIDQATKNLDRYDVVIVSLLAGQSFTPASPGFAYWDQVGRRIAQWVRKDGGKLVYIGPVPERGHPVASLAQTPKSPRLGGPAPIQSDDLLDELEGHSFPPDLWSLATVLPVKPGRLTRWTGDSLGATDHPLVRGLPFDMVSYRCYGLLVEPYDRTCSELTRSLDEQNSNWHRPFPGGGQSIFLVPVLGGFKSAGERQPDRWEFWTSVIQRLLYGLTYGAKAYPVLAQILLPPESRATAGQPLRLAVNLENRSGSAANYVLAVELHGQRLDIRQEQQQVIHLAAGERRRVAFELAVDLPCVDEYLRLRASVLTEGATAVLSQSTAWLPYVHRVPITLTSDRAAYLPGEPIHLSLRAPALPAGGSCRVTFRRVDRHGRVLETLARPIQVQQSQALDLSAVMVMPDWDPELAAAVWFNAIVQPQDDEAILGMAWTRVQSNRRWDMRQQMQFSVWSHSEFDALTRLQRDAGFNSLGFPGNSRTADRYAMRQYVEGSGVDTVRVKIDWDSWEKVENIIRRQFESLEQRGPDARSRVIVSLSEEGGFGEGWGRRYYWRQETAPPPAQKMFDDYLAQRYGQDIAALNAQWKSSFTSFDQIPLRKDLTVEKYAQRVRLADQAWMAMADPQQAELADEPKDELADEPKAELEADQIYMGILAPYYETYSFFDYYYQRYCDLVTKHYRARNPAPLTAVSLPSGRLQPTTDVPSFTAQGAHYGFEANLVRNAVARRDYGNHPGFSGVFWAYFDLPSLWGAAVRSHLLAGNTHLAYWVDVPLTFNGDLTHTRASLWTRQLTGQLRPIQPLLLHKRFYTTPGLALYVPAQPLPNGRQGAQFGFARDPNAALYNALTSRGYFPRVVPLSELADVQVLFASHAQVVEPADGAALRRFVEAGGLLVTDPMIASCNRHGNMLRVYPQAESGLAALLGFRLNNTSQSRTNTPLTVDLRKHLPVDEKLELMCFGHDQVVDLAADVEVLGRHADGQPLLLRRKVGRGSVLHLNMVFDFGPTTWSAQREGSGRLLDAILRHDGRLKPAVQVALHSVQSTDANLPWRPVDMREVPAQGPPAGAAVPWWGTQLYTDASGQITYFAAFTHHISPIVTADIQFPDSAGQIFDLLTGRPVPSHAGKASLTLAPGDAAFWAVTPQTPSALRVQAPAQLVAGQPLTLQVALDHAGPGLRGVVVDLFAPGGTRSPVHSPANVQVGPDGASVVIPTASNDPAGVWRVVITESITRMQAESQFTLTSPAQAPDAALMRPLLPQREDLWPTTAMPTARFLDLLRRLRQVYQGQYDSLRAKYMLSFFLHVPFEPESRHQLIRQLHRTDWQVHLPALAQAIAAGEWFFLSAEDLNFDPISNQPIDPFASANPRQAIEALLAEHGGARSQTTVDGIPFDRIKIGRGELILCRQSLDEVAYTSAQFQLQHQRIRSALEQLRRDPKN